MYNHSRTQFCQCDVPLLSLSILSSSFMVLWCGLHFLDIFITLSICFCHLLGIVCTASYFALVCYRNKYLYVLSVSSVCHCSIAYMKYRQSLSCKYNSEPLMKQSLMSVLDMNVCDFTGWQSWKHC